MKKILLIHGWNYLNYSSSKCTDAWANRKNFVELLERHFTVVKFNLPGFCGTPDPSRPWTIDDYTAYVQELILKERPDCLLGYSFGGAIALHWKKVTDNVSVKTFLISPAIIRRYERKDLSGTQRLLKRLFPERVIALLRNLYLTKVRKNPYYANATAVMRETYRAIVGVDLRSELMAVKDSVVLIYGEHDTATPSELVRSMLADSAMVHSIEVIKDGGHDIANSHPNELVSLVEKYLQ